jgi:hypothetical protein
MVNSMLKLTTGKTIMYGKVKWENLMNTTEGTRETVKEVLLTAAQLFDLYCGHLNLTSGGGILRTSMFDDMKAIFDRPGSGW